MSLFFMGGCASARVSQQEFNFTLTRGHYEEARQIAVQMTSERGSPRDLLWTLQRASLERLLGHHRQSNAFFDEAENSFAYFDQQLALGRSTQAVGGFLVNDAALPYTGKNYDRIMVNTYKALNFAVLGDADNARIEFNRALQRQNDAKTYFAKQAENLRRVLAAEKDRYAFGREAVDYSTDNARVEQVLRAKYSNLKSFAVYADFVNPFTTYVAGLYFWLQGDGDKAVDILKEAYSMSGRHPTVASDFNRASRGERPDNEAWIIFENGMAPEKEEIRMDLPILIESAPVFYVGAAFPSLLPAREAYTHLDITTDRGATVSTRVLGDMDGMIGADFQKELRVIIPRELARAALKTYFQYEMRRRYGTAAGVFSAIYQAATAGADVRMWSALPANFQLARIDIPADRSIIVQPPGGSLLIINLPAECRNVIIYIRFVTAGVKPVVDVIKF